MLRLLTLLLSCAAVCAQPVLSLNDPTVVAKSSSLLQGLVGYWQLEESSGTRYDRSPNGNHLTSNNSVGSATGKVGNAATFVAASSQALSAANTNVLQWALSRPMTCAAWIRMTNNGGNQIIIAKADANASNRGYFFYQFSNKLIFQLTSGSPTRYRIGSTTINDSTWRFVVSTYDGSGTTNGIHLYVNTTEETYSSAASTGTMTDVDTAALFVIGNYANNYMNGLIDEPAIWNRVLTATEISALYKSGTGCTYPSFSRRSQPLDFDWDKWQPLVLPEQIPVAFVNRKPELLSLCE